MNLTPQARTILEKRYLQKNSDGEVIEIPEQLFERVARTAATMEENDESWYEIFYNLMVDGIFLPNSPALMNAGTGQGTFSACYVLPLEDTMEGIMKTASHQAMIEKFGGGVGFPLTNLRPEGHLISTTQGFACGPIQVLNLLSTVGKMITQGGKRDGAHMAIMSVYHPDIMKFITCKTEEGEIHNFNISVGADKKFMEAVSGVDAKISYIRQAWPLDEEIYVLENPPSEISDFICVLDIWKVIIDGAWKNGEPGMVWLDNVNEDNATPIMGKIEATNPCGEQPLLPNESCNLGSINLSKFVVKAESGFEFDYENFQDVIHHSVRFLDNIIDMNNHPTQETREMNFYSRKIGLGIMGYADVLIKLGIRYDSKDAIYFSEVLAKILKREADDASIALGKEKGNFPGFEDSPLNQKNGGMFSSLRNAWRLSIAPTGTISMIANCSSGIEPLFDIAYKKHNMSAALENIDLYFVNDDLKQLILESGCSEDEIFMELETGSDIRNLLDDNSNVYDIFKTSGEISAKYHVETQAMWQKFVDSGISKTINLRNDSKPDDVENAYRHAWVMGCKGITVYRQGSREKEVLVSTKIEKFLGKSDGKVASTEEERLKIRTRPSVLHGFTRRINTGDGGLYVTINSDGDGRPYELLGQIGKTGKDPIAYTEAITRLISMAFRNNVEEAEIVKQLRGIGGESTSWDSGKSVKSIPDAIAIVIEEKIKSDKNFTIERKKSILTEDDLRFEEISVSTNIEECSHPNIVFQEGCQKCLECGWSKC